MSNEGGSYPSHSPHNSIASPLTYSFSSAQDFAFLQSPATPEYTNLTQLSPGYYNSPTIPNPHGQSPWAAHPASGPSSGGYHPTSSYSPTIPPIPLHPSSRHVPHGIAHKPTSSQKQERRSRDALASEATRQKPLRESCCTSSTTPPTQKKDAEPRSSSEKPTTELEQPTTAARPAHSRHAARDKEQRPQAQPTAQQGASAI